LQNPPIKNKKIAKILQCCTVSKVHYPWFYRGFYSACKEVKTRNETQSGRKIETFYFPLFFLPHSEEPYEREQAAEGIYLKRPTLFCCRLIRLKHPFPLRYPCTSVYQNSTVTASLCHRVDRVLGFFSSRPNWDSLTPSPPGECVPPSFGSGGGGTRSLAGVGVVGPNSDEGTYTVVLYIYTICT